MSCNFGRDEQIAAARHWVATVACKVEKIFVVASAAYDHNDHFGIVFGRGQLGEE